MQTTLQGDALLQASRCRASPPTASRAHARDPRHAPAGCSCSLSGAHMRWSAPPERRSVRGPQKGWLKDPSKKAIQVVTDTGNWGNGDTGTAETATRELRKRRHGNRGNGRLAAPILGAPASLARPALRPLGQARSNQISPRITHLSLLT